MKKPKEAKVLTTLDDYLKAGFVRLAESEELQKKGKKVIEVKNVEGEILHKLE